MDEFHYRSSAQEIIFGAGSLNQLAEVVKSFPGQRLMLCASSSIQSGGYIDLVQAALGDRLAAIFDRVRPHVQDVQLKEVLAIAGEKDVDTLIGMGGGSPIGMAKAAAAALAQKRGGEVDISVIAIPTTYAGSEMTPVYGITHTDENPPRKVTVSDPKIVPGLVIYDAKLTLDLPADLTASTGINALAHCIEALYSIKRNPVSTAAAIRGTGHIHRALWRCYQEGHNLDARTEMLIGAHLAGLALASATMGLHHGICHVLGGSVGVPHGIANSIILPHALRFNADATALELLPAAAAMGISWNDTDPVHVVEAFAQSVFELIRQMHLPQRLRDAHVKEDDLPRLALLGFHNRTVQNNPKPITDVSQVERLLRDAW